jgi:hypothetical protein
MDLQIHVFLTSVLVGGEWSALRPGRFTPQKEPPRTHCIGDWVGPRTGLEDVGRRKSCPYRDSNSDPLAVQHVASRYTDCAIALIIFIYGLFNDAFNRSDYIVYNDRIISEY